MAAVLKIAMARKRHRGFESHALRCITAGQRSENGFWHSRGQRNGR